MTMRRLKWVLCFVIVTAMFAVEGAFYLDVGSPWRRYAGLFWILCSAGVILSAWTYAFAPFFGREFWARPYRAWYFFAFFLPPVLILFNGGGIRFTGVDSEGLQQLGAGLYLIHHDPSFGVYRMSYFTYLARQYILNCLPSFVFGPSLWAARVGNSMFYIGAYLFFLSALASYFREKREAQGLLLTGYCGAMIALGQYTLVNARKFEQTTMPIGITLFFMAALILFLIRPGPLRFLWVTWAFGFFPDCYTPALGILGLALVILLYFIVRRRIWVFVPTVIFGVLSVYIAFRIVKHEDPSTLSGKFKVGIDEFTAQDWVLRYLHGARAVFGSDFTLIPAPLGLLLFAAVYLCWRYREYRYAAVCAWAVAAVFVSLTFVGSNLNFPFHDVHRAMVIIPPLTLGAILLVIRHLSAVPDPQAASGHFRFFMKMSMVYMAFTGVGTAFMVRDFFATGVINDTDEAYAKLSELMNSPTAARPKQIYLVPPLDIDLERGLGYFSPDTKVVRSAPPAGERNPGTYVFSYINKDPEARFDDQVVPSRHPHPYLKMAEE